MHSPARRILEFMASIDQCCLAYLCHNPGRFTSEAIQSTFRDLREVFKTQGVRENAAQGNANIEGDERQLRPDWTRRSALRHCLASRNPAGGFPGYGLTSLDAVKQARSARQETGVSHQDI